MTEIKEANAEDFQIYDEISDGYFEDVEEIQGVQFRSGLNPTVWRYRLQGTGPWMYTSQKQTAVQFGGGTIEGLITVDAAKALLKTRTRTLLDKLHKAPPASRVPTFNKSVNPGDDLFNH